MFYREVPCSNDSNKSEKKTAKGDKNVFHNGGIVHYPCFLTKILFLDCSFYNHPMMITVPMRTIIIPAIR